MLSLHFHVMPQYFFDLLEDDQLIADDDEGQDFASIDEAEREAKRVLANWRRDVIEKDQKLLVVEVRDGNGAVLTASLKIEVTRQKVNSSQGSQPHGG